MRILTTLFLTGCVTHTTVNVYLPDADAGSQDVITDSGAGTDATETQQSDSGIDAQTDAIAGTDAAPLDTAPDVHEVAQDSASDVKPPCTTAADCDDAIPCTVDACKAGICSHTPDPSLCYGPACSAAYCDPVKGCQVEIFHHPGCP